jgi:negative modulator of initiation of replication
LSREAIVDQCRHNQARQIPDTHYWAIMNIDTATKRRFLSRVLEFIGYREDIVDFACNAIGMRHTLGRTARPPV